MKFKKITQIMAFSAFALTSHNSFAQFTGDKDGDFGASGRLWYNYIGDGTKSNMTKLVLDENTEKFYFSGSIYGDGFGPDATVVISDLNGDLDPGLLAGTIAVDPFGTIDEFKSLAIQSNGKIVAVGTSNLGEDVSDVMVFRFNVDGSMDPTFNSGAPYLFDTDDFGLPGEWDLVTDVAIQDDGKIVIVGSLQTSPGNKDSFFLRLNTDGSPDGTFSDGGIKYFDTHIGGEFLRSVIILDNGSIAAVGQTSDEVLIVQLNTDGTFDTDFNTNGRKRFNVNSLYSTASKITQLSDESLLISGLTIEEGDVTSFVIKMDADGTFATDFNEEGTLLLNFETELGTDTSFFLQDMEVLPSGQILIAGDYTTTTQDIGLVLINENGEIDTDFGDNGIRTYNLSSGTLPNGFAQIEVSSTGAVYLSGRVFNGDFEDVVTFRLFGDISGLYEENPTTLDFNLYPNPATDLLNIQIDMAIAGDLNLQIVDLTGKIVAIEQLKDLPAGNSTVTIPAIGNLATGSYWLRVMTEGNAATQLFVKN